jgi:DNA replication licensing factor MCM6
MRFLFFFSFSFLFPSFFASFFETGFDLFFVVLDQCDEVTDTHIAQHIVSVHQHRHAAVQPPYSTEQLQRYIKFAREFDPTISKEAQQELVRCYVKLRESDANGASRGMHRITVRQLEAMVRLSEGLARLHLVDEVTPGMVKEAYKLLRKSIVTVQYDDVDLAEDEEATPMLIPDDDEEEDQQDGGNGGGGGDGDDDDDDDMGRDNNNNGSLLSDTNVMDGSIVPVQNEGTNNGSQAADPGGAIVPSNSSSSSSSSSSGETKE